MMAEDGTTGVVEGAKVETGDTQTEAPSVENTSGSVETTLTELAVQNTVTETMETKEEAPKATEEVIHPKKTKKKEESIAA